MENTAKDIISDTAELVIKRVIQLFYEGEPNQIDGNGVSVNIRDYLMSHLDLDPMVNRLKSALTPAPVRIKIPAKVHVPARLNGYNLYMKEKCAEVRNAPDPDIQNSQQHFSTLWGNMSPAEKDQWKTRAAEINSQTGRVAKRRTGGINGYTMCLGISNMAKVKLPDNTWWNYEAFGKTLFQAGNEAWTAYKKTFGPSNPLKNLANKLSQDHPQTKFANLDDDDKEKAFLLMCEPNAPFHPESEFRKKHAQEFMTF